jgi:hypothetical protein
MSPATVYWLALTQRQQITHTSLICYNSVKPQNVSGESFKGFEVL